MNKFEVEIIKSIRSISVPFLDAIMQIITFLGEQYILVLILAVIYFCYNKQIGQRLAFIIFTSLLINNTIKGLVQRPRPFTVDTTYDPVRRETATGFSFPSGHTQNASTMYTSLALIFKKKWAYIVFPIIIVLVAYSRIHLGVHYPTDVIVGGILGVGIAFGSSALHKKFEDNFKKQMILYISLLVLAIPLLIIFFLRVKDEDNLYQAISIYRDYYIAFSLFLGFTIAVVLEKRFVDFDCDCSLGIKALRLLISGIIVAFIMFGLKLLLPKHLLCDMLRYFLVTFVSLGIFPIVAKKWLFKKNI